MTWSREMSHLSPIFNFEFQYNLLAHIKSYILIHTPLQSDIWFKRYEQFFVFQNDVKHRIMSSVLAYNSKLILATSDSWHICVFIWMQFSWWFQNVHVLKTCVKVWTWRMVSKINMFYICSVLKNKKVTETRAIL